MDEPNTNMIPIMLAIARSAIESRAKLDGFETGEYDAEDDPEGYVISLLNALHQWCWKNGIDWENDLAQAQMFFSEDVPDASGATAG